MPQGPGLLGRHIGAGVKVPTMTGLITCFLVEAAETTVEAAKPVRARTTTERRAAKLFMGQLLIVVSCDPEVESTHRTTPR